MLISDFNVDQWYYKIEDEKIKPIFVVVLIKKAEFIKLSSNSASYYYSYKEKDEKDKKDENEWFIGYLLGVKGTSVSYTTFDSNKFFTTELEAKSALSGIILSSIEDKYELYKNIIIGEKG